MCFNIMGTEILLCRLHSPNSWSLNSQSQGRIDRCTSTSWEQKFSSADSNFPGAGILTAVSGSEWYLILNMI